MRKQKSLLSILMLALIFVFSAPLFACEDKTLEGIQNEYGIMVEGGEFTKGCVLVSNEIDVDSDEGKVVSNAIDGQDYNKNGIMYIYDIFVMKNGSKIQPNGKVKVTIPLLKQDGLDFIIFHLKDDGSVESLIPTKQDNKLIIETESFSYFVIVEQAVAPRNEFRAYSNGNGYIYYNNEKQPNGYQTEMKLGEEVTLTAVAEEGYNFVCWSNGDENEDGSLAVISTEATYTFTMAENEEMIVYAVFETKVTGLKLDGNNAGFDYESDTTMASRTVVTIGSEYTPKAENVLVSAIKGEELVPLTKDIDYTIDLGGLDFTKEGVYTITYTYKKDSTIKATILVEVVAPRNEFRAYSNGNGYIYYNNEKQPNGYQTEMKLGEEVTLTAVAEERYNFVCWSNGDENEDGSQVVISTEATYTFTMAENEKMIVYAVFEEDTTLLTFTYENSQYIDCLEHLYNGTAVFVARQDIYLNGTSLRDITDQEILDKITYKWVYANTDNLAPVGDDITIDGTTYNFGANSRLVGDELAGPCIVGEFEFIFYYDNVEQFRVSAKIQESTFKAITNLDDFDTNTGFGLNAELNYYTIVGIVEGKLYVMQMPKDCTSVENETNVEAEARLVTAGEENEIILGNKLDFVFTNFRYYYSEWKYYPSGEQKRENLLTDFGTGYYGSRLEMGTASFEYQVYRNCWTSLSGNKITRQKGYADYNTYGNLTKFAEDGSVKIYAPRKGETENNALRLVKDGDKYVFTGKDITTDSRESYPVFIYKWYVKQNEVYEFYGDLNKTYDGEAVSFNIYEKTLEVKTENEEDIYSLAKMEMVRFLFTDLKNNEVMTSEVQSDGTVVGPTEAGQYKLFIQIQQKGDDGMIWVTKAEIHTFEISQI